MKPISIVSILVFVILVFATAATTTGIWSDNGGGQYEHKTIRNKTVTIYGKGLYRDMSAEVAPQGIAQDYITLFIAIPLLIVSLVLARRGSVRGQYLLAGTLGYFLVTYLFYTVMGMYCALFLVYVILMGASFYAFVLTLFTLNELILVTLFNRSTPVKSTGRFLIFCAASIALLWLSIVIPPLLDGTIIPTQVEHYTTLIVQGLDLGILLPAAFISAYLWLKKKSIGYLLAPVYFIFLSILMTALTAKVVAMWILGYGVIPAIFIIPTFNLVTIICTIGILKSINNGVVEVQRVKDEKAILAEQC
jgi:hypothetical protein